MALTVAWVSLLIISLAFSAAELPFGMTPCVRNTTDFNICARKMVDDAMTYILQGRSVLFGTLDPFPLKNLRLNAQGEDISLHAVGKQTTLQGLGTAAARNFTLDLSNMTMSFDVVIPRMVVSSTCAIHGNILDAGIYADGDRFPLARMHSIIEGYSENFAFSLLTKTNSSGTFLLPTLALYKEQHGNATLTLENIFPAGFTPGERMMELVTLAENTLAKSLSRLLSNLTGQMVAASASVVMQLDTYDQFFPMTGGTASA